MSRKLSAIALIVLSGLFVLRNMEKSWYWIVSIAMIIAMSMSQGIVLHLIHPKTMSLNKVQVTSSMPSSLLRTLQYLVLYLMTLSSDVLDAILSLEPSSITQFFYILSAIAFLTRINHLKQLKQWHLICKRIVLLN
jgi:copper transport protein